MTNFPPPEQHPQHPHPQYPHPQHPFGAYPPAQPQHPFGAYPPAQPQPPVTGKPGPSWPGWTALGLSVSVWVAAGIEAATGLPSLWIVIPMWLGAMTLGIVGLALRGRPKWPAIVGMSIAGVWLLNTLIGLAFIYFLFATAYS